MGRRKNLDTVSIISEGGQVYVSGRGLDVRYRYRRWLFHVNPAVVPLGLRKEHRKIVYINRRRCGRAEVCFGPNPLPEFRYGGKGLRVFWMNVMRNTFGWYSSRSEFGYMRVVLKRCHYIITKSFTEKGNLYCRVFDEYTGEGLATLVFDPNFDTLYPSIEYDGWLATALTIAGYVADTLIYSSVASQLNKKVKVMW